MLQNNSGLFAVCILEALHVALAADLQGWELPNGVHPDTAVKRSRAGESGKLKSAITGNLAGLICLMYSRSDYALCYAIKASNIGCKGVHAYSSAQLQRHMCTIVYINPVEVMHMLCYVLIHVHMCESPYL